MHTHIRLLTNVLLALLPVLNVVNGQATSSTAPTVTLSYGAFQGQATGNLVKFLGMPFAAPPCVSVLSHTVVVLLTEHSVGNLRFAPPQAPIPFTGVKQATAFGAACYQQQPGGIFGLLIALGAILEFLFTGSITNVSEDCKWLELLTRWVLTPSLGLTINVVKPANLSVGHNLPVLFVSCSTCLSITTIHR